MKLNKRIALLAATIAAAVATTASAQWQLTGNTGTNTLGSTNSADFVFKTNNTTRGVVTAGGNVGIGTTSPAKLLHVNQSGSPQVRLSDPTANVFWDIWAGSNFLISRVTSGVSADWIKFDDVNHGVRIGPSAQFFISLAAGSVGRVGIGTTSPSDMLEVAGEMPSLPAAVEVAAYRIVVEALTNVARHTASPRAVVLLRPADDVLVVEVRDAAPHQGEWAPGVGLASMRERALEIGGTFVAGATAHGGRVRAELPLEPAVVSPR